MSQPVKRLSFGSIIQIRVQGFRGLQIPEGVCRAPAVDTAIEVRSKEKYNKKEDNE